MRNIAIITYNHLGRDRHLADGWHVQGRRRVLVLQNTKSDDHGNIGHIARMEQITILWREVNKSLTKLDQLVVYVGQGGSEMAISLAAQLPPTKVTFVSCSCDDKGLKRDLKEATGMQAARWIKCFCGGYEELDRIFRSFMETGRLLPEDAPPKALQRRGRK